MRIFRSTIVGAPVGRIWPVLRRFDGVVQWNPGVAAVRIEDGKAADQVGCIRHLTLPDGAVIRETLLALDDRWNSFTYDIIESPLPVRDYVATQRFQPVSDGERCYATWEVTFETEPGLEDEMEETIGGGIFESGLRGLKAHFEGPDAS